jgi:hypothetical protein
MGWMGLMEWKKESPELLAHLCLYLLTSLRCGGKAKRAGTFAVLRAGEQTKQELLPPDSFIYSLPLLQLR